MIDNFGLRRVATPYEVESQTYGRVICLPREAAENTIKCDAKRKEGSHLVKEKIVHDINGNLSNASCAGEVA